MFKRLFGKKNGAPEGSEVIRVVIRYDGTGGFVWSIRHQGGPSDVVGMAREIAKALQEIVPSSPDSYSDHA